MGEVHKWLLIRGDDLSCALFRLPHARGSIGEQYPVEMIHFVLENARQPTVGLNAGGLPLTGKPFEGNRDGAFDLPH
jgi:hypothetical protein